jgi:hypothetical protein
LRDGNDRRARRWYAPGVMAHRAGTIFLALIALALASCVEELPLESYELSGHVTALLESGDEGGPIADARVVFTSDTRIVEETTTDENGRYRMRVDTDHRFGQVRAEAAGFRPGEETVLFDTRQRRVDVALRRQGG